MSSQNSAKSVLRCCIAYNAHGGYCVPLASQHRPAAQKILAEQVYEPATIDFIAAHCGRGDVVHAGTYFGDFLPAISRACATGAQVWAFEPNEENFRCAVITCQLNGLEHVRLTRAALGEAPDQRRLVVADATGRALGGASRILEPTAASIGTVTLGTVENVDVVALDDILPAGRLVSVIQLDVEGQERSALAGAVHLVRSCLPILIVERLPPQSWLDEVLCPLGYHVDRQIHGNSVLLPGPMAAR
jgi:FkbM family methyltransferase